MFGRDPTGRERGKRKSFHFGADDVVLTRDFPGIDEAGGKQDSVEEASF